MRILVVEDEHKIANSIKQGLVQESYAVDVAYDGETGFDLASTEDFDLLILDIMLPGMDGIQVCNQLRQQGNHVPILMLTAKGQITDKVNGLDSGADDYLIKPFAFEELLARVRALLRRPKDQQSAVLQLADLELDTIKLSVSRAGKKINLSNKEYSLLEYLLRHSGQILTKDQIINHVWSYDSDILPNNVEVYIGYLRQKIDKAFPNSIDLIQTVRGFGYKISDKN